MANLDGTEFDLSDPIDISIPMRFDGPQPNAYGVEPATSRACEAGDLVGDTRRGGSCNFEQYTLIPHCNGTHTECVGHITHERLSIRDCLRDAFTRVLLVTVEPESGNATRDTYPTMGPDHRVISRQLIETAVSGQTTAGRFSALIVRTAPNSDAKLTATYGDVIPPYFTHEAMQYVVEIGIKHLIVDLPSIDRLYDEGRLSNHRIFWSVEPGSFDTAPNTRVNATITELAYVPNDVADGTYLLNLQIAPFASDASPSRPMLFRPAEI